MRTSHGIIMTKNLDRIAALRREVALLKEQDRRDRYVLSDLQTQNENIVLPLEENTKLLHQLESDVEICNQQKHDLNAQRQKLRQVDAELKATEWDNEVLLQKLRAVETDRGEWKAKAQLSILTAQRKSNFKNLLMERKLSEMSVTGERNTAAVAESLRKAKTDLDSSDRSQFCITDVAHGKMKQMELSRQRLSHIEKSHQILLERHRALLEEAKEKSTL